MFYSGCNGAIRNTCLSVTLTHAACMETMERYSSTVSSRQSFPRTNKITLMTFVSWSWFTWLDFLAVNGVGAAAAMQQNVRVQLGDGPQSGQSLSHYCSTTTANIVYLISYILSGFLSSSKHYLLELVLPLWGLANNEPVSAAPGRLWCQDSSCPACSLLAVDCR